MKKGKRVYTFQINCNIESIQKLIENYILGNQFQLMQDNGEHFYRAGDKMLQGYRYFNYTIIEKTLTIYAWFKGIGGEIPIEQNNFNMSYRNSLNYLFQEINKLNNEGVDLNMNNNFNYNNENNQNFSANQFANETTKKQEKLCEIGFWLSLFGLVASFVGVSYGVIVYILDFYFASLGLKTRKRKKAVATIVLSIISILIIILQLVSI